VGRISTSSIGSEKQYPLILERVEGEREGIEGESRRRWAIMCYTKPPGKITDVRYDTNSSSLLRSEKRAPYSSSRMPDQPDVLPPLPLRNPLPSTRTDDPLDSSYDIFYMARVDEFVLAEGLLVGEPVVGDDECVRLWEG
jgi:hypothetical protein